jgi:predicted RNase H-like nuclease (RuvC/YqgF family)
MSQMKKKACVPPSLPSDVVREIEVRARKAENDLPRYIDADALIRVLNAKADIAMGTPKEVLFSVAKMVDYLPATDVVPKSEVDRLNAVMKEMDEQRAYTINMLGESLEKAKAEVEELTREKESLAKTVNEASELIRKLRSKIDELKKKYTGDQS